MLEMMNAKTWNFVGSQAGDRSVVVMEYNEPEKDVLNLGVRLANVECR
jgi:hypothetical protein